MRECRLGGGIRRGLFWGTDWVLGILAEGVCVVGVEFLAWGIVV